MAEQARRSTNHPPAILNLTLLSLTLKEADSRFLSIGVYRDNAAVDDQKEVDFEQLYFSFFLGRMLEVWPHAFLRQLVARGCRRA